MIKLLGISGRMRSGKNTVAAIIQYLTAKKPYQVSLEEYVSPDHWLHTSENNNWQVKSFAYKLKQVVSLLTGVSVGDLEKEEVKQSKLPIEWLCWKLSFITEHNDIDHLVWKVFSTEDEARTYMDETYIIGGKLEQYLPTYREVLQILGTNLLRNQLNPCVWVTAMFTDSNYQPITTIDNEKLIFDKPQLLGFPKNKYEKTTFKCSCGKEFLTTSWAVETQHTKSCGCYQKIMASIASKTHGDSGTRLFSIYKNMKTRCTNKNTESYKKYGEQGIHVCKSWMHSYELFKQWAINNGYADNLSLDRIDNKKSYEPSNCRWILIKDQSKNKEVYSNNKLGVRGVSINKKSKKYVAQIQIEGKKINLGAFSSIEEASFCYEAKRKELFNIVVPYKLNNIVISDVRFKEECQAIEQRGGIVVRVERLGLESKSTHISETSLDNHVFAYTLFNDKDIPYLVSQVKAMLKQFKIPYND